MISLWAVICQCVNSLKLRTTVPYTCALDCAVERIMVATCNPCGSVCTVAQIEVM